MASNTTIDGYYVNSSGAWSQSLPSENNNKQIVIFADAYLEKNVRRTINKPTGTLYKSDVAQITNLSIIPDAPVYSLSGIENLVNLQTFSVNGGSISDISALKGLTNLQFLSLMQNQISDVSVLKELTNLQNLRLSTNQISDISALSGLTNLQTLQLDSNQINDINALNGLTSLQYLNLSNNPISDTDIQSLIEALPKCSIVKNK